ncbi:hypothetical protein ANANG_G00116240 [Anguilla anguilla]|uniref:BHLH domain-containing protein n=1 Tax=Anguilla anguilla TaxID=7936 RepID=A0A9D3RX95_ANGAN|nr:hypothetical protein ANANG_G00116240 [Anguilla anguilla]
MSALGEKALDPTVPESRKRKGSPCDTSAQSADMRRRELGWRYIDELADLLSANMGDIAGLSVKPDKCHMLRSAVDQIQQIKKRELGTANGRVAVSVRRSSARVFWEPSRPPRGSPSRRVQRAAPSVSRNEPAL